LEQQIGASMKFGEGIGESQCRNVAHSSTADRDPSTLGQKWPSPNHLPCSTNRWDLRFTGLSDHPFDTLAVQVRDLKPRTCDAGDVFQC
jgi:hypothetical protein